MKELNKISESISKIRNQYEKIKKMSKDEVGVIGLFTYISQFSIFYISQNFNMSKFFKYSSTKIKIKEASQVL